MLKIEKSKLHELYSAIEKEYALYLPIKRDGEVNYEKYFDGAEVSIETLRTTKSPKDLFFPQTEDLMAFKVSGQNIEVIDTREVIKPFVLMGVKACDYKAFDVLDKVFLVDPIDTYYKARREAGIVITSACGNPDSACFCKVFKIDASNPVGDITTWQIGEELFWQANTEKGNLLTEKVKHLFTECDNKPVEDEKNRIKETVEKLPYANLDISEFNGDNMMNLFNSDKWQKLSEACLGCGTCTFVCPTCQCFDIREFNANDKIKRFRCWDSCMYSDFTKTAGGQPRPTQMQRYRQRFMHKLVYFPMNNGGEYSCVGCGRCVKKCPERLNIVKVIKTMGEKGNE